MHRARIAASLWFSFLLLQTLHAAPYVPTSDNAVIERLPGRNDPAQQEFRRLRAELAASPNDVQRATQLARRYIEVGRSDGDPRYFGYAQATLSPWWNQNTPPNEVRILRATLLQSRHQFDAALADLDAVLASDRGHVQAWLTRATILQVMGNYEEARKSCSRLQGMVSDLIAATCAANVNSLNGQATQSYTMLRDTLQKEANADPGIKVWVLTLLAEMAVRLDNPTAAEAHFRQALALDPSDGYLLGAYADFLLDQNRPAEVISLLKNHQRADGLLLRYALALKRQNAAAAAQPIDTLRARFAAAKLRGDNVHEREQARFELHLQGNPREALTLAQENWKVQKEPADARILLEAASISNDADAARPVLDWLKRTGLEDRALAALAAKITGAA